MTIEPVQGWFKHNRPVSLRVLDERRALHHPGSGFYCTLTRINRKNNVSRKAAKKTYPSVPMR